MNKKITMRYPTAWHQEMWREGAPFGNGVIGGMVYGGILRENILINHALLWRGGRNMELPDISYTLPEIRRLLDEKKIKEADAVITNELRDKGYGEVTITKKDTGEKCFLRPGYVYFIPANHEYDFTTPSCFDKVFLHVSVGMIDGRDLFSLVHEIVELPYDMSVFETLEDKLAREELDAVIKMKEITNQILYRVMALKPECIEKRLKIE